MGTTINKKTAIRLNSFAGILTKKFTFLGCVLMLSVTVCAWAQTKVSDALYPLPDHQLKFSDLIGQKLDACITNQITAQNPQELIEPFKYRKETRFWQSEFWGKWFTSAVAAYKYSGDKDLKSKIDMAITGLLATQTPNGYIGNYLPAKQLDGWDIWGRKYCLLGILSYYDLTKDPKCLVAARKLTDHLIQQLKEKNTTIDKNGLMRGMAASSILEPVVQLYKATKDAKYLAFAEEIVASWENDNDPGLISKAILGVPVSQRFPAPSNWFTWEQGQKSYEMMSCYEGLLELYKVTQKENYLIAVVKVAEQIYNDEIMLTGSGSSFECWYDGNKLQHLPARHMMETCVTATWMKLCAKLHQVTGESKWVDRIETTAYNALFGAMKPNGNTWSKYSAFAGYRHLGTNQSRMNLNCCMASGPRGLMVIPQIGVMTDKNSVVINLFSNLKATALIKKNLNVDLVMKTDYPRNGKVDIEILPQKTTDFTVKIRIPGGCQATEAFINGKAIAGVKEGSYLIIDRKWKKGDKIELDFGLKVKIIEAPGNSDYYAFKYGPLLLAADDRLEKRPNYEFVLPDSVKNGSVPFKIVPSADESIFLNVKVRSLKEANIQEPIELLLCDFASAGNTWTPESAYKVWFPKIIDITKTN